MHCNCAFQEPFACALQELGSRMEAAWVDCTASTNDDLKGLIRRTAGDVRIALVADKQTAGRGTHGRSWTAPCASLLLSEALPLPEEALEILPALSLVCGAACAQVLMRWNPNVRLKWPNDIWINGGKAAGILCEVVNSRAHRLHAVVGIGVNIHLGRGLTAAADAAPACLLDHLPDEQALAAIRVNMAAALAATIEEACEAFGLSALRELQKKWPTLDAFADKRVLLSLPDGTSLEGVVKGIGPRGEVLFQDDCGRVHAYADARLRPLHQ